MTGQLSGHVFPAMTLVTAGSLLLAFVYAVLPYLCLYLLGVLRRGAARISVEQIVLGSLAGLAAVAGVGTVVARVDLDLYETIHAVLLVLAGGTLCWRLLRRRNGEAADPESSGTAFPLLTVMALAFIVRLVPTLIGGSSLGGGDARFHNLLARSAQLLRSLPETWEPFAPIRVMYPLGSHLVAAFLADSSGCPVHHAVSVLLAVVGALTTGLIFLLATELFSSRASAVVSAGCYAFLALWGSLDYFRWGGLPNALGMLLVCLLLLLLICGAPATGMARTRLILGAAGCLVSILLVHHYSLLVAALLMVAAVILTTSSQLRLTALASGLVATLAGAPLLVMLYLRFAGTVGATSVFTFREPVLFLWTGLLKLGPALIVVTAGALLLTRERRWSPGQLLVLAWLALLLVAFVSAEFLYRGAVLLWTHGQDSYTCFTPSRMVTDCAYPMSILAGMLALSRLWQRHRSWLITVLVLAAVCTVGWTWQQQWTVGVDPQVQDAGRWLHRNSPADALVVGVLPHLEYLSWRETVRPPLPASEERHHPSVTWKNRLLSYQDWLSWQDRNGRPVYFILRRGEPAPRGLQEVYSNDSYVVVRGRNHD